MLAKDEKILSGEVVMVNNTMVKMINQDRTRSALIRINSPRETRIEIPSSVISARGHVSLISGKGMRINNTGISISRVLENTCFKGKRAAIALDSKIENRRM